jgi:hypothetical protein
LAGVAGQYGDRNIDAVRSARSQLSSALNTLTNSAVDERIELGHLLTCALDALIGSPAYKDLHRQARPLLPALESCISLS